jgi:hypothetical protein
VGKCGFSAEVGYAMRLIFFRKSTKELVLSGSGLREVGHGIRLGRQPYVEMKPLLNIETITTVNGSTYFILISFCLIISSLNVL